MLFFYEKKKKKFVYLFYNAKFNINKEIWKDIIFCDSRYFGITILLIRIAMLLFYLLWFYCIVNTLDLKTN